MSSKGKILVGIYIVVIASVVAGSIALGGILLKGNESQANSRQKILRTKPADYTNQKDIAVRIKNHTYTPANIKVRTGTTITWTNDDPDPENAMQEHSGSEQVHEAPTSSQVKPYIFAGPTLATGQSYSFTFNQPGTFIYHSATHPSIVGQVVVVD